MRMGLKMGGVLMAAIAVAPLARPVFGAFQSSANLVVVRLDKANAGGGEAVHLDEIKVNGLPSQVPVSTVDFPTTGPSAFSLSDLSNHDGHLHLSSDGHFLTLGGYSAAPGATDPSTLASATTPRVIAVIGSSAVPDLTTRLTDTFNQTAIRAVSSTDGKHFWIAGDNAGGAIGNATTGGLRYVSALGGSTSVNLSQVQTLVTPNPDNVRDVGIFGGGLYDASGSNSSIGKAAFRVSVTLPTSGSQTLTKLTTDGISLSSIIGLDRDSATPGIDTIYGVQDGAVNKYIFDGTNWIAKGLITAPTGTFETLTARVNGNNGVDLYVGSNSSIFAATDSSGFSGTLSGSWTDIYDAPQGSQLRGLDFVPTAAPEPASIALLGSVMGAMALRRRRRH